ncbi:hypothetical protein D3C84_1041960 [compost metagenome]
MPVCGRPGNRRGHAERCRVDERVRAQAVAQYPGCTHVQWLLVRRDVVCRPGHGVDPPVGLASGVLCGLGSAVGIAISDTAIARVDGFPAAHRADRQGPTPVGTSCSVL